MCIRDSLLDSAAAAYYRRSEPCARADAFVSHAWHDDHRLKYLALCYRHNLLAVTQCVWRGDGVVRERSSGGMTSYSREVAVARRAPLARLGYFGKLAKEYRSAARPASTAVVRYLFL